MRFRTISIGLAVVAGILLTTAALRSQMPAVGPVWEFATVTEGSSFGVTICYATTNGCRTEHAGGLINSSAKLGEKGWELTAVSDKILYFKRLRSAIHRND